MTKYCIPNIVTAFITLATGCALGADSIPREVARNPQAIQGGKPETGYIGVGLLRDQEGEPSCTGALIAARYVLTAGHCIQEFGKHSYTFELRDSAGNTHVFDIPKSYPHPLYEGGSYDQRVLQLDREVDTSLPGLELLRLNEASLPTHDTICTAVGYGTYTDEQMMQHVGEKRSCDVAVDSADEHLTQVQWKTGIPDHVDSGGPLICNGVITAVVRNHAGTSEGIHTKETYTTLDVPWIQRILEDPSSNERDPRIMHFDCASYPSSCVEHDGELQVRECSERFGLRYYACGEHFVCTETEDPDSGSAANCQDPDAF